MIAKAENTQKFTGIAAGMLQPKKEQQRGSLYLNYGLLGLMTNLREKGFSVQMFQGDYKGIDDFICELSDNGALNCGSIFLLSVPNFLSLEWAIQFAKKIKSINPEQKIIVGRRWVLDKNLEWVKEKFRGCADAFCRGCPDGEAELFADIKNWRELECAKQYKHPFYHLDYTILHNYNLYQPVLEASRGCGFGCNFCLEKDFRACGIVSPKQLFWQIGELEKLYETRGLNIYFESSVFLPTIEWSEKFRELYRKNNSRFLWRCTTRVDAVNCQSLEILAQAGLKAVDFGLESASAEQLLKMNKTKNPLSYLEKAEYILRSLSSKGVWAKLNILLYAGETLKTFSETKDWLLKNKQYIKGISANPLAIYLNGLHDTLLYCDEIEKLTGRKVRREELLSRGITYVDLSDEIDVSKAFLLCRELSGAVMTKDDYLDLKSICYSQRG